MSEEGGDFDPCECEHIWLLNVLRQSQAYCTDNECYTNDPSPRQSTPEHVLLMSIFFVIALFLYYFRPRSQTEAPAKPTNANNGSPPNPPPAIN